MQNYIKYIANMKRCIALILTQVFWDEKIGVNIMLIFVETEQLRQGASEKTQETTNRLFLKLRYPRHLKKIKFYFVETAAKGQNDIV